MATLGSKTTGEQALQRQSLQGKKAIVTGANSGLGVETARLLALAGADVMLACRSLEAGEKTANQLRSILPSDAGKLTDFLGSVYRFAGKLVLKSIPQGAAKTIYSATALELAPRNGIYLSDCAEKAPISAALDGDLAEKLWDLSEKAILTILSL